METDRYTIRQIHNQTDGQTDKYTIRQIDKQTERKTKEPRPAVRQIVRLIIGR